MHDICRVQKPGNKFSPKTAFLDTLWLSSLDVLLVFLPVSVTCQ